MKLGRPIRVVLALVMSASVLVSMPAAAGTVSRGTLQWAGVERSYRLFVPSSVRPDQPAPLVVAMHGGLGTGEIFASQSDFDATAEQHGFITVYPDGIKRVWNAGTCCGPAAEKKVDDVGFIRALVAHLAKQHRVDQARIYGTGFSNGAMLAHRIACEAPDLFAAIAPVSGGRMIPACESRKKVSALLIQGKLDKNIPWDGGTYDGTYRPSIKELVGGLSARNGCSGKDKVADSGAEFECRTLEGCPGGVEVSWCGLPGVGHQWPGGKTFMKFALGPNTETFQASRRIGDFFARQQR